MPLLYNPNKWKYEESNHEHVKKHTGVWKRGYTRRRLNWKGWRYHLRIYDDGRQMVSYNHYDPKKQRVTNTIEIWEWEEVRKYFWYNGKKQKLRKEPAESPYDLQKLKWPTGFKADSKWVN